MQEEMDLQELYQTNCEEIDLIFGAKPSNHHFPISSNSPSKKRKLVLSKKQNFSHFTKKATLNSNQVDLLIAYYVCQLQSVRYGITLPNNLKEPEEIKEAIHTYQLQRFQKRMGHKSR